MIFACVSVKGGAGKSTVAVNLASEYMRRGSKVLLVDADPQGTSRVWSEVAAELGHDAPTVIAMGKDMARPGQLDQVVSRGHPTHRKASRALTLAHSSFLQNESDAELMQKR